MITSEPQNVQALDRYFADLVNQWPSWEWLREKLRKSDLVATSARPISSGGPRNTWLILAKPSETLVKHFELAPEVLILCSPWDEMQANDIDAAESLFRQDRRVDPGFALAITHDRTAETRLRPVVPDDRQYIFVHDEAFSAERDPQAYLRQLLRQQLGRRRLFDFRHPAAGPQFFGRNIQLEALARDVLSGHCLGVFGLRKVGKTSLLKRMSAAFREVPTDAKRVIPIEVDLQTTPFNRRTFEGIVGLIVQALDTELERAKISLPSRPRDPQDRLASATLHIENTLGARILLILDEYEVLLGGRIPTLDGVEVLTWLRGVAQARTKGFSLVLAGRNSRLLAPARIEGADNPMYRFLRKVPLAGLTDVECRNMVRTIGARMALRFDFEALDIIVRETGGHPALARTFGDQVDEAIPASVRIPAAVNAETIQHILPAFSRNVNDDMRELVNASNDFDSRAGDFLVHLAHGAPWIGGPAEARINDALVDYGILNRDTHSFRIGHLAIWLRENYTLPLRAAHG